MSRCRLTTGGKRMLRKASRQRIEAYFSSLTPAARAKKWLQKNNRYRVRCIEQYSADIAGAAVSHTALIAYIAASGPTHVVDGWSLLARAIDASFRGDTYAAIHLGYYAELRAAMGLLGCEGIGIFNNRHPVVDEVSLTHLIPKGQIRNASGVWENRYLSTHAIVWPILSHWADLQSAGDLLSIAFRPEGISLPDWLLASGAVVPATQIAKCFLNRWGLDLAIMDDDHNSRNLASYRPSELRQPAELDVSELVEFVEDLWSLFEPSAARRFPVLERHLLRRTLKESPFPVPPKDKLLKLGLDDIIATDWITFLSQPGELKPLEFAGIKSSIEDPRCHLQVISRAALLLSVATAAARRLLTQASYDTETIAFWWLRQGSSRGFWDDVDKPEDPLDRWADIEQSLNDARNWRAGAPGTLRSLRRDQAMALERMGGFELAGIWGLLP